MDLRVSGKNFSIGEAMRKHVSDRIQSAVQKYFDGGVNGHVVVDHEGSGYRSDCTLHLASGITLQAEGRAIEPYASFEQAADRLERRLRRYKQRLKDHHGASANADSAPREIFSSYVLEAPEEESHEADEFNPVVVAEKTATLRRLSVSEAVLDIDMTGAPVLVFRNAGTDRVNIVYRRSDGNIGWIDPAGSDARKGSH
ncbi:MAG: ribosome-associated translation inhibitor RaiA [Beijerinckiaceae bacterium]|nr:ribosome-associated translation inhibitor RaiA [Beijerinckiaceae bacterium]